MAGGDHYRHSSTKGVNVKFEANSLALNETCSDTKFNVYWYYGYCVTRVHGEKEEEEEEEEEHGQNRKSMFSSNMKRKWYYSEIFHTQFCFDMFYTIKSPEVEIT